MEPSTPSYSPTERTKLHRRSQRAVYDNAQVHAILDEGFVCHIGFVMDGQPFVIPTAYGRSGEELYIHGSPASRVMRRGAEQDLDLWFTVTLVDRLREATTTF